MRLLALSALLVTCGAAAGGCGTAQSDVCRRYVACQEAFDQAAGTGPHDLAQYEEGGACWGSADDAARCDQECSDGIAANAQSADDANLDVPACRP